MRRPGKPLSYELHTFTDASTDGYAACVYLRTVYSGDVVFVSLVCAKSRVAPVRQQTVPRLELQGACNRRLRLRKNWTFPHSPAGCGRIQ